MVFATAQQLLGSSIFSLDPQDKLLGQERVSPTVYYDRIVCLIQKRPSVKKCRNGSSSSSAAPLSSSSPPSLSSSSSPSSSSPSTCGSSTPPMALKEHLAALAFDTCSHKGYVVLEREPEGALSMESWSEIEELLTELQRSLLETQWALTSEPEHRVLEVEEASSIVRSGRPSARQRRFGNRKQNMVSAVKDGGSSCAAPTHESNERKGKHLWISEALATVTTLGLRGKRELLTKEEEVILSKKMKVGQNLKAARRKLTNVLGYEPSDEVWASSVNLSFSQVQSKILEADRARDQMFVCNLRLVFSVANKYSSLGVSLPDLIQEGAQGLLRGLEKFNHKKGFKLSTYVHWWIRQGITRALADHSRTVRLPAHMHERLGVINRAAATLRMEGVTVSVKSLSQAVNLPDEMVTVALKATKKMISLDKTKRWGHFNPEEESLHNYVADLRPESDPWIAVDKMSMRDDVDGLLAKILNKREREIVRLHYGLDRADGRGVSLEKISHRYGISRERTRQVEGCALRKLAAMGQRMDLDLPLSIN